MDADIVRYLEAIAAEAAELSAFFPQHLRAEAGASFDRLYQPPERLIDRGPLRPGVDLVGTDPEPEAESRERAAHAAEAEAIPWCGLEDLPARRSVLVGDAGGGKSWVLRGELRRLAREGARLLSAGELPEEAVILPVRISVAELLSGDEPIAARLLGRIGADRHPAVQAWSQRQLKRGCSVIMLDGWDEAAGGPGAVRPLRQRLDELLAAFPRARMVVASRPLSAEALPAFEASLFELPGWDVERQLRFARAWCGGKAGRETGGLLTAIYADPRVRQSARNPLLLALVCRERERDPSTSLHAAALLESCLVGLLAELPASRRSPGHGERLLEALSAASLALFEREAESFAVSELTALMEAECPGVDADASWDDLVRELKRVGVLVAAGTGRLRFLHQRFYEYLAARGLAERTDGCRRMLERIWDPRWQDVLVLGGARLEERVTEFVQALLAEGRRDLFARPHMLAARVVVEGAAEVPGPLVRRLCGDLVARVEAGAADWRYWSGPVRSVVSVLASHPAARTELLARFQRMSSRGETHRRIVAELVPLLEAARLTEALLILARDADPETREAAAARLAEPSDLRCLEALIALAGDEVPAVRAAAAVSLGQEGGQLARSALLVLAEDDDFEVRACAVESLGRCGDARSAEAALRLLREGGVHVEVAARALGRMRASAAFEPLRKLAAVLSARPHPLSRGRPFSGFTSEMGAVIDALGAVGGVAAVSVLRDLALDDELATRRSALLALSRMRVPEAAEALLDLAERASRPTEALIEALQQVGDDRALPVLSGWAWDVTAPRWVRADAVRALAAFGADAVPHLLLLLRGEVIYPSVQAAAALAIGRLGAEEGREALIEQLGSPISVVRLAAARGLAAMGDRRAGPELARWTRHRLPAIRMAALTALAQCEGVIAIPKLLAALADPTAEVRDAALQALRGVAERERIPIQPDAASLLRRAGHRLVVTWNETDPAPRGAAPRRRTKARTR